MPDKAVPQATKDTDKTKVTGKRNFEVEIPGTPGIKSNYRQTVREEE
ncbi:hypothetical protein [Anaeroselena agilis]|uniref:Uncharacterized protein n=1 Tax=Anaeroselena agilis TaxID=3063788 RepID=A0ABU3P229_9FIRM|nr:hypothetical protein [Selenomonadales bacterium 4137-cl]